MILSVWEVLGIRNQYFLWKSYKNSFKNLIFPFFAGIINQPYGDVPKWLKGADSKSARRRKACGGSNPSISAKLEPLLGYINCVLIRFFFDLWTYICIQNRLKDRLFGCITRRKRRILSAYYLEGRYIRFLGTVACPAKNQAIGEYVYNKSTGYTKYIEVYGEFNYEEKLLYTSPVMRYDHAP